MTTVTKCNLGDQRLIGGTITMNSNNVRSTKDKVYGVKNVRRDVKGISPPAPTGESKGNQLPIFFILWGF